MRLKKLEINGFKSFASRLELQFSHGITGIVGPNGCGKTNIVDAIRWVLGEQRTRLLRNDKMENVIFNGTELRKPLGMAEVHLLLSNEDRSLPIDYSEVTISRRLYRSGNSEYLLNGEPTRLKEIRKLLFGTGLGNHGYAIIERQMIDTVLNDKDQDKKRLFEEAAGIMRYRYQREEALRKIEATEADLARINDILAELEKEVRSLRYQMGKARRFERLREKVEGMELTLLKKDLRRLARSCRDLRKEKDSIEAVALIDDSEISALETHLERLRLEKAENDKKMQELQERRYTLAQDLKEKDEAIAVAIERIASREAKMAEDTREIERARVRCSELLETLARLEAEVEQKRGQLRELDRALAKGEEDVRSIAAKLDEAEGKLAADRDAALARVEQQALRKSRGEYLRTAMAKAESKLEETSRRLEKLAGELDRLQEQRRVLEASSREQERRYADLSRRLEDTCAEKDRLTRDIVACGAAHERTKERREALREKKALWSRILRDQVEVPEGFRGYVGQMVKVEKEFRKCFEACLSPFLSALVAPTRQQAWEALEKLRSSRTVSCKVIYPEQTGAEASVPNRPQVIGTAASLAALDQGVKDHLLPVLAQIAVVENLERALPLVEEGFKVATLDGFFFDGEGTVTVAAGDEVLLDYKGKVAELEREEEEVEREEESLAARLEMLREKLGKAQRGEEELRAGLEETSRCRRSIEEEEGRVGVEIARRQDEVARLREVERETGEEIERSRSEIAALADREELEDDRSSRPRWVGGEGQVHELAARKEELQEELSNLKLRRAAVEGEITNLLTKKLSSERLLSELEALSVAKEEEKKVLGDEVERLRGEIELLRSAIAGLHEEGEAVEREVKEVGAAGQEMEERCSAGEKKLKDLMARRERDRAEWQEKSVAMAAEEARLQSILDKVREKFNLDLSAAAADPELLGEEGGEGVDEEVYAQLRAKLARFGPVNMLAKEEYEDRKERYDFLSRQKKDLEDARDSLVEAIRRINREARRRMAETFEQIKANFKATFAALFGGGQADLYFVDSEDPLEANVKIVANPKGKKLHDISSLSGGERALVALSLLFAIYLVRPSPFCVFDEVDAPLDDANVGRFINMLRSFSDRTQFVVVTHNKKTMEAADFLYGVTMEEPGVSRLISVQMTEVDRLKRPASAGGDRGHKEEVPLQI